MANPTTNFGWVMPTATDLVTDLPADFNVFGQGVDTSMQYLLGGTTGQVLSKTSATSMAFTWVTPQVGDITAVNVTSPITGGGTSGDVTIAIQDASTAQKGSVQLSDSTSTTSSVLAATPTAVKSAYDLANAAIAKTTVTTAGDIIYRNATVPTRLGIGTASQVLAVNSGATAPEWVTPASGAFTLISDTTISGNATASISISSIPSSYKNLQLIFNGSFYESSGATNTTTDLNIRFNGITSNSYKTSTVLATAAIAGLVNYAQNARRATVTATFANYNSTALYNGLLSQYGYDISSSSGVGQRLSYLELTSNAITSLSIFSLLGYTFNSGTRVQLYGLS